MNCPLFKQPRRTRPVQNAYPGRYSRQSTKVRLPAQPHVQAQPRPQADLVGRVQPKIRCISSCLIILPCMKVAARPSCRSHRGIARELAVETIGRILLGGNLEIE